MQTSQQELYEFIFQTLNITKSELESMELLNAHDYQKFMEKMQRTLRRKKAKLRSIKKDVIILQQSKKVKKKYGKNITRQNYDKKTIQMIRNRISAQISRDKKKQYIAQLESQTQSQLMKNKQLKEQLELLRQKNQDLLEKRNRMVNKFQQASIFSGSSKLKKIGLILLTLISVFYVADVKQEQNKLINKIKIEDQLENISNLQSYSFDKSFTIYDNNEIGEEKVEEKFEATEESENCFNQSHFSHRLYYQKNFEIFQNF